MNYVMSDIHGCYAKYTKMLEKISFSEGDALYILGDCVDRGPAGLRVLLDAAKRKNVVLLRGNHDHEAAIYLSNLYKLFQKDVSIEMVEAYQNWLSDGGNSTLEEYLLLSESEQEKVIEIIEGSAIHKEITVNEMKYFMAHSVPEKEKMENLEHCTLEDFLMGEPDYETSYYRDKVLITGHTPTGFIDSSYKGRIWKKNNHIAIDCGAVFGNDLGCLCLETMEEFYV